MQERIRDQKPSPQALGVGKVGCVMAKVRLIRKNDTLRIMDKFLTCKLVVGASGGTAIQECLRYHNAATSFGWGKDGCRL
eukprot:scaffold156902_cov15-Tisochrysis_lutea.AAC.1